MTQFIHAFQTGKFISIALLVLLVGCGPHNEPATVPPEHSTPAPTMSAIVEPVVADRFEIKGHLEGNQLTVSLQTDLPDSVIVMANVSRNYVGQSAEGMETYGPQYWEERMTVGALRTPRTITIDDETWAREVEENLKMSAIADQPKKIVAINQTVTVSMTVPKRGQSAPLQPNGENLAGKVVIVHEDGRVIRAERSFPSKLSVKVKTESTWINPERLEVGTRYRLSDSANVLPEFSSANPLADLAAMITIPAGTVIEVRRIDDSGHDRRYLVRAHGDNAAASGWISVNNLLGQALVNVK